MQQRDERYVAQAKIWYDSGVDTSPRGVIAEVMDFDPSNDTDVLPGDRRPLRSWLHDHPEAWLYSGTAPKLDENFGQKVTLLVGEAGCGKSTSLDSIATKFAQPENFVVRLDFTHAVNLMGDVEKGEIGTRLADFTRDSIVSQVSRRGLNREMRVAKIRFILRTVGHSALSTVRESIAPDPDSMDDMTLLGDRAISEAIREYESQSPDNFVTLSAVQLIHGKRVVLLIDNIDHVRPVSTIEIILQKMSALLRSSTMAFVAIRSEHERAASVLLQGRRGESVYMDRTDSTIIEIARVRALGAEKYVAEHSPQGLVETKARVKALLTTLDAVERDKPLLALTTSWLNGNVRQMLTLITNLSLSINMIERQSGNSTAKSVAGVLYSQAITRAAPQNLELIFHPNKVYSEKYRSAPFVFLPLRILAYLKSRNGIVRQRDMIEIFKERLGVQRGSIENAVQLLEESSFDRPSLVRRTIAADRAANVILLPCGRVFIDDLVYSCDFLAFLYDHTPNLAPARVTGTASVDKFAKSVIVVRDHLLPLFLQEHPYMAPDRKISVVERQRLSAYEELFNYGSGQWFIQVLRQRLERYAKERDIHSPAWGQLRRRIDVCVEELDRS